MMFISFQSEVIRLFKGHFHNSGTLTRFILRQDRIRIPVWIVSLIALTLAVAGAFSGIYTNEAERGGIAETMRNPAMTAMVGPGYGLDNYTIGAMMAHQMLLFTAIAIGVMSILLVTRHTRSAEEDGRLEMIHSLPTGRLANLAATFSVMIAINFLLAILTGFSLYALRIESIDLEGSLLYGAALGATGIFFASLTAIFAQISENGRGTIGLSIGALLVFYLIRAVGDVSSEALSWVSPLGWILHTKAYVANVWWPVALMMLVSLGLICLAFYLHAKRDAGAGLLAARPGKKHASSFLLSPIGLSLRLQRTALLSWAIGLFVLGASYGSVFGDLEAFFSDNDLIRQMLISMKDVSLTEQFIGMLMAIMAITSSIPPLMAVLKPLSEERKNRTEHLLTRAVSRTSLLGSALAIAIIVSFLIVSLTAIGLWAAAFSTMDDPIGFLTIYEAAIVYLPAIWLMIGIAVLLIGFFPRGSSLIWLYLIYAFIVTYLGDLLDFPDWLKNLTPYGYVPALPVEELELMPLFILTVIAFAISFIGMIGYRKRDIEG